MNHPFDRITVDQLRGRRSLKWRRYPDDVIPAWVAEMDFPLAEPITAALVEMIEAGDTGYAFGGDLPQVYAAYALDRDGFAPDPGRSLIFQDVLRSILVSIEVLTAPGDGVAFLTPAYPPFFGTIAYAGRRCVPVPMAGSSDRFELDVEVLHRALSDGDVSAFLLCNPHNPTGRVFSVDELAAVSDAAERHGVVVLSDEVHAQLTYPGATHVPFASLGTAAALRSVTYVSASKAWNVPGLKCGLTIAAGAETWAELQRIPIEVSYGTSIMGVAANIAAFRYGGPWLADTLEYLTANRNAFGDMLRRHLPGARWTPPEATYLVWVDATSLGLGEDPAAVFLDRGRVAVSRGLDFGPEGAGFVRVNLATPRHVLEEAVRRMGAALADAPPGRHETTAAGVAKE